VGAGEQAALPRAGAASPRVMPVSPDVIRSALAWQAPRLQFSETPLAEAVAEFNRLNHHQLTIGDPELANLAIGGTFRPDNVDGFVRLLCTTLDVRAESAGGDRTILRRAR
jgi:transmembrane sensor